MLLSPLASITRQTHLVGPTQSDKNGLAAFVSRVRVSIDVEPSYDACALHFVVWPFPNPHNQFNSWAFKEPPDTLGIGAALKAAGLSHGKSVLPMEVSFASTYQELLAHLAYTTNATPPPDPRLDQLHSLYHEGHAFAVGRVASSGTYELQWQWWGQHGFVAARRFGDQLPHELLAIAFNTGVLEWADTGNSFARIKQRVVTDKGPSPLGDATTVLRLAVLTEPSADVCTQQYREEEEASACLLS